MTEASKEFHRQFLRASHKTQNISRQIGLNLREDEILPEKPRLDLDRGLVVRALDL